MRRLIMRRLTLNATADQTRRVDRVNTTRPITLTSTLLYQRFNILITIPLPTSPIQTRTTVIPILALIHTTDLQRTRIIRRNITTHRKTSLRTTATQPWHSQTVHPRCT